MKAKVKFSKKFGDSKKGEEKIFRIAFARKLEAREVAKIVEVYDEKSREQLKKKVVELQSENMALVGENKRLKAEKGNAKPADAPKDKKPAAKPAAKTAKKPAAKGAKKTEVPPEDKTDKQATGKDNK